VLINGGMVGIEQERESSPAIVEAFYPGFWGATAIAETVFGLNDNLGGKIPVTVYNASYVDDVSMTDMEFAPHDSSPGSTVFTTRILHLVGVSDWWSVAASGRTYRYYTGVPTFPAFTGISLTTFNTTEDSQTTSEFFFAAGDLLSKETVSV